MNQPDPTAETAVDRLFALIASIPGSGTVAWCDEVRALLDEITAPVPPVDRAALRTRIAEAVREFPFDNYGLDDVAYLLDSEPDTQEWLPALADAVLAVLPAGRVLYGTADTRAAVLREAATIAERLPIADRYRHHSKLGDAWDDGRDAVARELRRLAGETPASKCGECDHPHGAHREGEDPVSPGRCTDCPETGEEWHDYQPAAGARQDGAQTPADTVQLDEDGRDIETGCFPGCASQSFPDPGICYCGDEAAR